MNPLIVFRDIGSFFAMMRAVFRGQYKMPWGTFFWAVLCLFYFVSPIDLLPDILPLLGIADDGAFLVFVLMLIHKDVTAFRNSQNTSAAKPVIIEAEIVEDNAVKKEK